MKLFGQSVSLDVLDCESFLYTIDAIQEQFHTDRLSDIKPTKDGCAVYSVVELHGGKVAVLVQTQPEIPIDDTGIFEIRLYRLPSWQLDAERAIPGKQSGRSYILPSQDRSSILFIASTNELTHERPKFAYRADAKLTPLRPASVKPLQIPTESDFRALQASHAAELKPFIPLVPVKELQTLNPMRIDAIPGAATFRIGTDIMGQAGIALIHHGGRLTVFPSQRLGWYFDHLAETGDAVISRINAQGSTDSNIVLTGRLAVYSAETGKETASLDVPPLKDYRAKCLALWHDEVAVYVLPKSFVLVNFAKQNFRLLPFPGEIQGTLGLHPIWVENPPKSAGKPGR